MDRRPGRVTKHTTAQKPEHTQTVLALAKRGKERPLPDVHRVWDHMRVWRSSSCLDAALRSAQGTRVIPCRRVRDA